MTPLLVAENIEHGYDYTLFEDINLKLEPCKSVAILGTSGTGKSTLLHILSSFIQPQKGYVKILNKKISELNQKELEVLRKKSIGIVFQQHYLFKGFSARENILTAAMISGEEIDNLQLEFLGIEHLLKNTTQKLSGGEQQRVSIARVLVKKPKIIYADEPTGNLDKKTAQDVMGTIFNYIQKNNAGMFLVSHDENIASKCDRVLLLENKQLKILK